MDPRIFAQHSDCFHERLQALDGIKRLSKPALGSGLAPETLRLCSAKIRVLPGLLLVKGRRLGKVETRTSRESIRRGY